MQRLAYRSLDRGGCLKGSRRKLGSGRSCPDMSSGVYAGRILER